MKKNITIERNGGDGVLNTEDKEVGNLIGGTGCDTGMGLKSSCITHDRGSIITHNDTDVGV